MSYETTRNHIDAYLKDYYLLEKAKSLSAWQAGLPSLHKKTKDEAAAEILNAIKENKWQVVATPEIPQPKEPTTKVAPSWLSLWPKKAENQNLDKVQDETPEVKNPPNPKQRG